MQTKLNSDTIKKEKSKNHFYLVARDKDKHIVEKIPFKESEYKSQMRTYKQNRSFNKNIIRTSFVHVEETSVITARSNLVRNKDGTIDTTRQRTDATPKIRKGQKYRYAVSVKDKSGNQVYLKNGKKNKTSKFYDGRPMTASGRSVGSETLKGTVTDKKAYAEAYSNLYALIARYFIGVSDEDEGRDLAESKGWLLEESVVYYDEM
jgi:hypothetical protein